MKPEGAGLVAIVDIGSNSVRLVVYESQGRAPAILFNEKVMAGLGRGVAAGGRLDPAARALALDGLRRFAWLIARLEVGRVDAVATAAVRLAADGQDFLAEVRALGVPVRLIAGDEEARLSALGVGAGIPGADGIVGDLGGGSVELVRLTPAGPARGLSIPLGALELEALGAQQGRRALTQRVDQALAGIDWWDEGRGRPLYTVGGSWRALAHLHMHLEHWPLPVIHHHVLPADGPRRLVRVLSRTTARDLKAVPGISSARAGQLLGAALLLDRLVQRFGSSAVVASAYGLREGVLYDQLPAPARAEDPLLFHARGEAARSGRLGGARAVRAGERLAAWAAPLLAPEAAGRRLLAAAALLADVAWRAHPDMRPQRARDAALEGGFVGVDPRERAMLAMALWSHAGGAADDGGTATLMRLAPEPDLARARAWGLGLRLGQRIDAGTGLALEHCRLERAGGRLVLAMEPRVAMLAGDSVRRRLKALASALGLEPSLRVEDDVRAERAASSADRR